jgi:hypothetical protein
MSSSEDDSDVGSSSTDEESDTSSNSESEREDVEMLLQKGMERAMAAKKAKKSQKLTSVKHEEKGKTNPLVVQTQKPTAAKKINKKKPGKPKLRPDEKPEVCAAVNHPTVSRRWFKNHKYTQENIYGWAPVGTRGGHRMVLNPYAKKTGYVACFIHSLRCWSSPITRGHDWMDGYAAGASHAYYSVSHRRKLKDIKKKQKEDEEKEGDKKKKRGRAKKLNKTREGRGHEGWQWSQLQKGSPVLWYDGIRVAPPPKPLTANGKRRGRPPLTNVKKAKDDGMVFRGVGTVEQVRTALSYEHPSDVGKPGKKPIPITFITIRMNPHIHQVHAGWIMALAKNDPLAKALAPAGWETWCNFVAQDERPMRGISQSVIETKPQALHVKPDQAVIAHPEGLSYAEMIGILRSAPQQPDFTDDVLGAVAVSSSSSSSSSSSTTAYPMIEYADHNDAEWYSRQQRIKLYADRRRQKALTNDDVDPVAAVSADLLQKLGLSSAVEDTNEKEAIREDDSDSDDSDSSISSSSSSGGAKVRKSKRQKTHRA